MEHPEDTFEAGLSWPQFTSLYAKSRKGAGKQEVSSAWSNYKTRTLTTTKKSPTKKSPSKRSLSKKSPIRSVVGVPTLAFLPADILRVIAGKRSGAAAVLAQLSRKTHAVTHPIVSTHCSKDIGRNEMRNSIIRVLLDKKKHKYPKQDKIFFSYQIIAGVEMHRHVFKISLLEDKKNVVVEDDGYGFKINGVSIDPHVFDRSFEEPVNSEEIIADIILAVIDLEIKNTGGVVFPSRDTISDILSHRGKCKVDYDTVTQYAITRIVNILHSFNNPVLEDVLKRTEWSTIQVTRDLAGTNQPQVAISMMMLGRWDNDRNVIPPGVLGHAPIVGIIAHGLQISVASIGRMLGINVLF